MWLKSPIAFYMLVFPILSENKVIKVPPVLSYLLFKINSEEVDMISFYGIKKCDV
jgi:hypothetical protein